MSAAEPNQHIGVALSGGGHRAALFALGALLYLVDAGKGRELSSVSSVSGGSITNGAIAQRVNLKTVQPEDFRLTVKQIASQITRRGTVFAWFVTRLYCALAVLLVVLLIAVPFAPALPCWPFGWWTVAIWLAVLAALVGWAKLRSRPPARWPRRCSGTNAAHWTRSTMTLPTFCVPLICRPDSRSTSRNHLCTRGNPSGASRTDCRWPRRFKPPPHFPSDFNVVSLPLSRFYSSHPLGGHL